MDEMRKGEDICPGRTLDSSTVTASGMKNSTQVQHCGRGRQRCSINCLPWFGFQHCNQADAEELWRLQTDGRAEGRTCGLADGRRAGGGMLADGLRANGQTYRPKVKPRDGKNRQKRDI